MTNKKITKRKISSLLKKSQEIASSDKKISEALQNAMEWGYKAGQVQIVLRIKAIYDSGRLKQLSEDKFKYTDKEGKTKTYSAKSLSNKFIKVGDWEMTMDILGITKDDLVEIIKQGNKLESYIVDINKPLKQISEGESMNEAIV